MTTKAQPLMKQLLNQEEKAPRLPKAGELVEGEILKISKNAIIVSLDPIGTGIIYGGELKENRNLVRGLEAGQTIKAMVVEPENEDGYIELSLREATIKEAWTEIKDKKEQDEAISAEVIQANRGGLVVNVKGIIGFLPVSQLSPQNYPRVEGGDKNKILQFLNQFVGKEIKVKILDLDKKNDKLIVSEKAADKKKLQESLGNYKKGDVVEGTVTALADFGAFIKLDENIEGLAHISELDWNIIDHPSRVLAKNQQVQVQISDIQEDQVSLSLKALQEDPWKKIEEKYQNGQIVAGKVVKLNHKGALIEVDDKIHGIVNAYELPQNTTTQQILNTGEKYNFKITSFAPRNHKMTLVPAEISK
jgi:small subunit ribosomal protein S1